MYPLILFFCLPMNAAHLPMNAAKFPDGVYLKLTMPKERERFTTTSNISVRGVVLLPKRKRGARSVNLSVRLYRPHKGSFVVYQDAVFNLQKTKKKGVYLFKGTISHRVPFPPGKYMLRVCCMDMLQKGWPVIETGSAFIELVSPVGNIAAHQLVSSSPAEPISLRFRSPER